jgi:hypothetical protein
MNKKIKDLESKSLSNDELMKIIKNKANLLIYHQLEDYDNIDDVLGRHKACILLYETALNYGHWCCVFKRDAKTIEFFDPYGLVPDSELKWIPKNLRKDGRYPHLSYLMYNSPYKFIFNDHKLQKHNDDVSTCGRHVGVRLVMKDMKIDKYAKLLNSDKRFDPDYIVTALTAKL